MSPKNPTPGVEFSVHIIGNITGKAWPGKFRAKESLTFRDKMNADLLRRQFIGEAGGNVDPEVAAYALVISQLSVRLTEVPEWWKNAKGGLDLEDSNILEEVWSAVKKVEEDHLKKVEVEGKAAQTTLREEVK